MQARVLQDMDWCQDYAMNNRRMMMHLLAEAVEDVTGCSPDMGASVNIHHNYCQCEDCSWQVRAACYCPHSSIWSVELGLQRMTAARHACSGCDLLRACVLCPLLQSPSLGSHGTRMLRRIMRQRRTGKASCG